MNDVTEREVAVDLSPDLRLMRESVVTIVPDGVQRVLPAGERVTPVQALGGSATVRIGSGEMARLSTDDAVELGLIDPPPDPEDDRGDGTFSIDRVWAALATVYDPEIPIDIVELGLVYRCEADERLDGTHVEVDMSVTAPFCGMGDVLRQDAAERVAAVPGVTSVNVQLVLDPPWDQSRMSQAARLELGML